MSPSPLGETLRRARLEKAVSFEDAERVTRIPRKYLEALEVENFGILPAPVYARGFLRSYAGYLGLDPNDLLPFFPVGHVEEPKLDPLPEVSEPRTWNMNGVVAMAVVGLLILLVVGLYAVGREDSDAFTSASNTLSDREDEPITPPEGDQGGGAAAGSAITLPDLLGLTAAEAIGIIEGSGADYIVIGVREGDVPAGQVVGQEPGPGAEVGPGNLVQISVSQ